MNQTAFIRPSSAISADGQGYWHSVGVEGNLLFAITKLQDPPSVPSTTVFARGDSQDGSLRTVFIPNYFAH